MDEEAKASGPRIWYRDIAHDKLRHDMIREWEWTEMPYDTRKRNGSVTLWYVLQRITPTRNLTLTPYSSSFTFNPPSTPTTLSDGGESRVSWSMNSRGTVKSIAYRRWSDQRGRPSAPRLALDFFLCDLLTAKHQRNFLSTACEKTNVHLQLFSYSSPFYPHPQPQRLEGQEQVHPHLPH